MVEIDKARTACYLPQHIINVNPSIVRDMEEYKVVSQLDENGYFLRPELSFKDVIPFGAVDHPPPMLAIWQAARWNPKNGDWIIEEDPQGLHTPENCFLRVVEQPFVFEEDLPEGIPQWEYSLAVIRFLGRDKTYLVQKKESIATQRLMIVDVQNRIPFLMHNLGYLSHDIFTCYEIEEPIHIGRWGLFKFKTKFGIEQSVYCMKIILDTLVQLTCLSIEGKISTDNIGQFLGKRECGVNPNIGKMLCSFFEERNYKLMKCINDAANSYKHSLLQGYSDTVYDREGPFVSAAYLMHGNFGKPATVYHCEFKQVLYGFYATVKKMMLSLEKNLSPAQAEYLEQRKGNPWRLI